MNNFYNYFRNISNTKFLILYLCIPFAYTLLLGLQGFDMCDEGWCLTGYQQLFEHPTSAEYQFLYYNGVLVGALWNCMFAKFGIIGFRLLSALFTTAISFVVYKLLENHANRWHILIGISIVLIGNHFVMIFHHNVLTAFLCSLSVYCIFKALTTSKQWLMIIAGGLIGINIYTRIPNASMLSLSLILIPYYIYTRNGKATFKMLLFGILGLVLGIVIEASFMAIIGHWSIFIDNLASGFSAASSDDSTHQLSKLFIVYYSNYLTLAKYAVILLPIPIICYLLSLVIKNKKINYVATVLLSIVLFALIFKYTHDTFTIYTVCYLIAIGYAILNIKNSEKVYLIILALLVLFFLPFGSDYGIGNMGPSCIWIAVPLCVSVFLELINNRFESKPISRHILLASFTTFCLAFCVRNVCDTTKGCYFDKGSRFAKTHQCNYPLANTFTTKQRQDITNELLPILSKYVQEGDYLLCWESLPMIHYLTHTYPYLNNSWPWTYDVINLERHFDKAQKEIAVLPVIICNKSSIAGWDTYNREWDSEEAADQWNFNTRKIKAFHSFVENNHYVTVWENDLFRIMLPSQKKTDK